MQALIVFRSFGIRCEVGNGRLSTTPESGAQMNEATLEANLHAEVLRLFPSLAGLRIKHQATLTLRLGHRVISINGEDDYRMTGRFDAIVTVNEVPAMLFELKRPGLDLAPEDKEQAISYARLLTPMPPLVVISNGTNVEFYQTYDKEPWEPRSLDETIIQSLVQRASTLAGSEKDSAIRLLLGRQPELWTRIIKAFTKDALKKLRGAVEDASRPLAQGFSIRRRIVDTIAELITTNSVVALVGSPLSGKTNVMSQLCQRGLAGKLVGVVPLYVDVSFSPQGILQAVANLFTRELFSATSVDDVRAWLLNALRNPVDGRLVIVIDGCSAVHLARIQTDIAELVALCQNDEVRLLVATDDPTFSNLTTVSGRPTQTEFGQLAQKVDLPPFDLDEFGQVINYFGQEYNAVFNPGAEYNTEYRNPREIRLLSAEMSFLKQKTKANELLVIPSVTDTTLLRRAWEWMAPDPRLKADFKKLARAFLDDREERRKFPLLNIMSYGKGHIRIETAERILGSDGLNRLLSQGHVELISYHTGMTLVLPKIPELLSAAVAFCIAEDCTELMGSNDFQLVYGLLLIESQSAPYGDMVGAFSVIELAKQKPFVLLPLIETLLKDEPRSKTFRGKKRLSVQLPGDSRPLDIVADFDNPDLGTVMENTHPWLVLSHLADSHLFFTNHLEQDLLSVLASVASFPSLLRRPDIQPLDDMKAMGFHFHDIPGHGSVLCHNAGIVEPIVQALRRAFSAIPVHMLALSQFAVKKEMFHLIWRLHIAASESTTVADPFVAKTAQKAVKVLDPVIRGLLH